MPLPQLDTLLTSRTAIEDGRQCKRMRYLRYFHLGRGIVPSGISIYLATGSAVHVGIGYLGSVIKQYKGNYTTIPQDWIEEAVNIAKKWYTDNVDPLDLTGGKLELRKAREFAFEEQQALVEALIRCWGYVEMPKLINRFKVVKVENDVCYPLSKHVQLESRADMVLRELDELNQYYVYSLKTAKMCDDRTRNGLQHDLQGVTETWAIEKWFKERNEIRASEGKSKLYPDRVMGVRFCVLVKGDRGEEKDSSGEPTGIWFTYNPFIRGYKNLSGSAGKILYAHSWYYEKTENKSGRGTLGKGWVPFYVWRDYKGGIKQWMKDIWEGKIQSDYCTTGDMHRTPFYQHVVVPTSLLRRESDIKETMLEIELEEENIFWTVNNIRQHERVTRELNLAPMGRNRRGCFYPQECDYTPICWGDTRKGGCEIENVIDSGMYKERIPHHKKEMELYGIEGA